jgi:uncharacterized glyoxalase superfamily protein PhnB
MRQSISLVTLAEIARAPAETFYGGYAGVFRDLDGHSWEVGLRPG